MLDETLSKTHNVVNVLRHAKFAAVKKNNFVLQTELIAVIRRRQFFHSKTHPVIEDFELVSMGWKFTSKIPQVCRGLYRNSISNFILKNFFPAEEVVNQPFAEETGVDRPSRKNIS